MEGGEDGFGTGETGPTDGVGGGSGGRRIREGKWSETGVVVCGVRD